MEHLAPDVWTERVVAKGFPTVSAVVVTAAAGVRRRHAHRPAGHGAVLGLLRQRTPRARRRRRQHPPPLGPRLRQRRLPRRRHRRPPRLPPPHDRAAEHQPTSGPARRPRACRCRPSPSATASPTTRDPETVHLIHTPGHTEDSHRRLLGARRRPARRRHARVAAAELLPSATRRRPGCRRCASSSSCRSSSSCPATGRRGQGAHRRQRALHQRGVRGRGRGQAARASAATSCDLPAARFLAEGVELDAVYEAAHAANLEWAWDEV